MQMLIRHTLKANIMLLVAVLLTLAIIYLSLTRAGHLPDLKVNQADKYYHAFAYFTLTLSWLSYFKIKNKSLKAKFIAIMIISLIFFGTIIEIVQKVLTTYRMFDYQDMIANAIGVLLATILFLAIRKKVF